MNTKTFFASLLMAVLFSSCDPNADKQVGNSNRVNNANSGGSGSTGGSGLGSSGNNAVSSGTTTDAPLDGGLSILLLAGTAYGAKRVRDAKRARKEK